MDGTLSVLDNLFPCYLGLRDDELLELLEAGFLSTGVMTGRLPCVARHMYIPLTYFGSTTGYVPTDGESWLVIVGYSWLATGFKNGK
jgi:hypothetical protein